MPVTPPCFFQMLTSPLKFPTLSLTKGSGDIKFDDLASIQRPSSPLPIVYTKALDRQKVKEEKLVTTF